MVAKLRILSTPQVLQICGTGFSFSLYERRGAFSKHGCQTDPKRRRMSLRAALSPSFSSRPQLC